MDVRDLDRTGRLWKEVHCWYEPAVDIIGEIC